MISDLNIVNLRTKLLTCIHLKKQKKTSKKQKTKNKTKQKNPQNNKKHPKTPPQKTPTKPHSYYLCIDLSDISI